MANSVLAYQHGARQVDGALCALGAGAGNSPTEVLAATFNHLGVRTGVDVGGVLAAAEEVVRPFLPRWPKMDRSAIVQGWAGVYSSFLLHAERAAERYGVPAHEILQRAGELGYVGGQEDMIIDIAVGAGPGARPGRDRELAEMTFIPHVIDGQESESAPRGQVRLSEPLDRAAIASSPTTPAVHRAVVAGGLSGAGSCALVLPGQYEDGDLPGDLGLVLAERGMPRDQRWPQLGAGGVVKLLRHCGERLGTHLDRDAGVGLEIVVPGRVLG